jgi:hypothetical protein
MFTAFQIVKPNLNLFRSYWRFVNTFCQVVDGAFGQEIIGIKNVKALQEITDRYLAYVPKEVVADQLPEGKRVAVDVAMTPSQARVYHQIEEDMLAELESGDLIIVNSGMGKMLTLRQLLCCPRILDESLDMGGGYDAILERLEDQSHAVIFVPFRPACDYVTEALRDEGYDAHILRGGTEPEELRRIVDEFREKKGIIVCTIAYAESFDLETCETSYFLGYDFNVDPNEQAEGRTRRAISEHPFVTWNYLRYRGTIDDRLLVDLEHNMNNVSRILARPEDYIRLLRGEQN